MSVGEKIYDFKAGELLLFDKDLNWTSFDVVQRVRNSLCRNLGIKKLKVGHAGTLDPLATGLLILCTGKATQQIESLQIQEKEYVATIKIGAVTPTYDLETEETQTFDISDITPEIIEKALDKFKGEIMQVPPVFSAVKINGKRAFSYARNGEEPELKAKKIEISHLEILSVNLPEIEVLVKCSKGTYIRALARDIGNELKCGAYLTGLRRTKIGAFKVESALTIDYFLENIKDFVTN